MLFKSVLFMWWSKEKGSGSAAFPIAAAVGTLQAEALVGSKDALLGQ